MEGGGGDGGDAAAFLTPVPPLDPGRVPSITGFNLNLFKKLYWPETMDLTDQGWRRWRSDSLYPGQ